jgi:hypothetical protein
MAHARWLYSRSQDIIYQRCDDDKWVQWERSTSMTTRYMTRASDKPYRIKGNTRTVPDGCILISTHQRGPYIYIMSNQEANDEINDGTDSASSHNEGFISSFRSTEESAFGYNILLHQGMVFTDGSSDNGRATYAVVVQPPDITCSLANIKHDSFIHFSVYNFGSAKFETP